jgi:hypothetical protein
VGAIETAEEFGFRIYTKSGAADGSGPSSKWSSGDGAVWIWNLADEHFTSAIPPQ